MKKIDFNKYIWEGWTVGMFIEDLEVQVRVIMEGGSWRPPFKDRDELKKWCMENQPYYKKYVPEVVAYFAQKYNIG